MSTTHCVPDLDALPAGCAALFEAARDNFFATDAWWRTMLAAGMPADAEIPLLPAGPS